MTAAATTAQKTDAAPPPPPAPKKPAGTVTLENRTGRRLTFHLSHETCSEDSCSCQRVVVGVQDHDKVTGKKSLRALVRRLPDAITLNARRTEGSQLAGLPLAIVRDPAVAKAIRKKKIAFTKDADGTQAHDRTVSAKLARQKAAAAAGKAGAMPTDPDENASGLAELEYLFARPAAIAKAWLAANHGQKPTSEQLATWTAQAHSEAEYVAERAPELAKAWEDAHPGTPVTEAQWAGWRAEALAECVTEHEPPAPAGDLKKAGG